MFRQLYFLGLMVILTACGGGGGNSPTANQPASNWPPAGSNAAPDAFGYFVDSRVEGVRYKSGDHYGETDSDGRFGYLEGALVTFFVGDIMLGEAVLPAEKVTPWELAADNPKVALNIARFLQSLDDDDNLLNGIRINSSVHFLAQGKTADFTSQEQEVQTGENSQRSFMRESLENLIMELTSATLAGPRQPLSANDAYMHFSKTINDSINAKEAEARAVGESSTCITASDCGIETASSDSFYRCSKPLELLYSTRDVDWGLFQNLLNMREYFIYQKQQLRDAAYYTPPESGSCLFAPQIRELSCNTAKYCEWSEIN